MKANICVLDVETGGLKCKESPITQLALQIVDPLAFDTVFDYDTFVAPYNNLKISAEALAASRVSMAEINEGIPSLELVKNLINIFKAANSSGKAQTRVVLLGHNIGFDIEFLEYLFTYHNKNLYDYIQRVPQDTIWWCRIYEAGSLKNDESTKMTLTACCERLDIQLRGAHGAPADVEATRQLFSKLVKLLRNANGTDSSERDNTSSSKHRSARTEFFFEF